MKIYTQLVELFDSVVDEYREVVSSANTMADRGETLDHYDLSRLIKANARADAARRMRKLIEKASDEDFTKVSREIHDSASLDTRNANGSTHFALLSFYNSALEILDHDLMAV